MYIQYWCIDGKYRMYVARLRNGEKTSISESFHPFCAEPHNTPILYLFYNTIYPKNSYLI